MEEFGDCFLQRMMRQIVIARSVGDEAIQTLSRFRIPSALKDLAMMGRKVGFVVSG